MNFIPGIETIFMLSLQKICRQSNFILKKVRVLNVFAALSFFILIFLLNGCAGRPYRASSPEIRKTNGIYHRVKQGETLWRIVKTYNVALDDVVRVNRIPDATRIRSGQLIFIPKAKEKRRVIAYEELKKGDNTFIWPLRGKITSYYGAKKGNVKNKGIDIRTKKGAKVVASQSGRVSFSDEKVKGLGKTIFIEHRNSYTTVYAHNSRILVKVGDRVKQGEVIALAGSTGRTSIPILHLEIRKNNQPRNPFHYLP